MASFRSLIADAHNIDVGQVKLEIKDGVAQLDVLEADVRHFVEVELRKQSDLWEEFEEKSVTPTPTTPVVAPPAPPAVKE